MCFKERERETSQKKGAEADIKRGHAKYITTIYAGGGDLFRSVHERARKSTRARVGCLHALRGHASHGLSL